MSVNLKDSNKKEKHWDICLKEEVRSGKTGFKDIFIKRKSLSEASFEEINISQEILGFTLKMPFFISSMTGGWEKAEEFNLSLSKIANSLGIPLALGSHKILYRHPDLLKSFLVKKNALDIPLFSNIGALQLKELPLDWLLEINKKLEVQAQVVHLNILQELCQPEGDRNFKGLREALLNFIESSPIPVIVKETGGGIRSREVSWLLDHGVAYVDLAGSGGTNWGLVESFRQEGKEKKRIQDVWENEGVPSAYSLYNLSFPSRFTTFTSGGMEEPLSPFKALAMGTSLVGFARSVLLAWQEEKEEGVFSFFNEQEKTLKEAMMLVECFSLEDLRKREPLILTSVFREEASLWK